MAEFSLSTQNPWWLKPSAIDDDNEIVKADSSRVKWEPRIMFTFDLESDLVYTLRGPRQVGKTTSVKLMIRKLLQEGVHPRRIFYWTCDLIEGPNSLAKLLDQYISATREMTKERLFIFLDEISAVKDWQRGVKYLHDTGMLSNVTLLLTGSHSIDILKAAERLPGRRGVHDGIMDKIMLPMKFSEYVELRSPELRNLVIDFKLYRTDERSRIFNSLSSGVIPPVVKELNLYLNKLAIYLDDYLLTGGLISSINQYILDGRITDQLYTTYINTTLGDITRWNKKETYLAALINRIDEVLTTRISWNRLKKGTDISHTNTVADYVDILESSFILLTLYNVNLGKDEPRYEDEKKIYFRDPFIFHALRSWVRQRPPYETAVNYLSDTDKSRLVESIVADHLTRLAFNLNPTSFFDPKRNLFYWRTKKHEIDFVMRTPDFYVPIEVKYQKTINKSDYSALFSFPGNESRYRGLLVTRETLDIHRETTAIPVPILLTLI